LGDRGACQSLCILFSVCKVVLADIEVPLRDSIC